MKSSFLFVYGSLIDEENEFANYLKGASTFYSPGKVKGKLYDIGQYPGAVLSAEGDAYVYGNIMRIDTPEIVFKVVDEYEGCTDEQSWHEEFTRVLTYIETEIGIINCWVYVYSLPVNGLKYIKGGRYKA